MQRYRSGHNGADSKSVWEQSHVGSNPTRCATSEQALYRLLRLFFKSQSALMPLLLLSKPNPLSLGFGLGPPVGGCFLFLTEISILTVLCKNPLKPDGFNGFFIIPEGKPSSCPPNGAILLPGFFMVHQRCPVPLNRDITVHIKIQRVKATLTKKFAALRR